MAMTRHTNKSYKRAKPYAGQYFEKKHKRPGYEQEQEDIPEGMKWPGFKPAPRTREPNSASGFTDYESKPAVPMEILPKTFKLKREIKKRGGWKGHKI
jgi:hypothetical protein